ncbi:hypothetical protein GCM10027614_78940 [Micromonospora vulcania]
MGNVAQLLDPTYAAGRFYAKLLGIPGWQTLPLTEAAQRVQVSAYPDAYAKWEPEATQLVGTITSGEFTADWAAGQLRRRQRALDPASPRGCRLRLPLRRPARS